MTNPTLNSRAEFSINPSLDDAKWDTTTQFDPKIAIEDLRRKTKAHPSTHVHMHLST